MRYLDAWNEAAGIGGDKNGWLFRSIRKGATRLTNHRMDTNDVLRMVKRQAKQACLFHPVATPFAPPVSPAI
jgi:hypothetical protein